MQANPRTLGNYVHYSLLSKGCSDVLLFTVMKRTEPQALGQTEKRLPAGSSRVS